MESNEFCSENAAQLFSRLGAKQSLDGLDKTFFRGLDGGLSPGDSVQLFGEEGCGKTELLVHFCVTCILPKVWSSINLSGKETKVVFIDTSYKFPLWRVVHVIEENVRKKANAMGKEMSTAEMDSLIKESLQRLYLVRCSSSLNLVKTLSYLGKMFEENPEISLIMVDSISEFYWTDKTIGGVGRYEQETHQRSIIAKLKMLQDTYHLVVIVTKSAIMNQGLKVTSYSDSSGRIDHTIRNPDDYLSPEWNKFLTYKFEVMKTVPASDDQTWFTAKLQNQKRVKECKFLIKDSGIEFVCDEIE